MIAAIAFAPLAEIETALEALQDVALYELELNFRLGGGIGQVG